MIIPINNNDSICSKQPRNLNTNTTAIVFEFPRNRVTIKPSTSVFPTSDHKRRVF